MIWLRVNTGNKPRMRGHPWSRVQTVLAKLLTEMENEEFQALMDDYITRSAERDDAIPTFTFLSTLSI